MKTFQTPDAPSSLTLYLTLDEVKQAIPAVSLNCSQLAALGFHATKGSEVAKQLDDPSTARRYRSAMLYRREDLPSMRAAIAAAMGCATGEQSLIGEWVTRAPLALPAGYACTVHLSPAGTTVLLHCPGADMPPTNYAGQLVSDRLKSAIKCAQADAAMSEKSAGTSK